MWLDYFAVSPDPHLTLPISVLLVVRAWNPGDLFHSLPPCFSSDSISLPKYLSNLLPFLTSFSITGVQAMGAAVGTAEKSPPCSPLPASLCSSSTPVCPCHFSAWNPSGPSHYSWDDSVTFPQGRTQSGILPPTESCALGSWTFFLFLEWAKHHLSGMFFSPPPPPSSLYPRSHSKYHFVGKFLPDSKALFTHT